MSKRYWCHCSDFFICRYLFNDAEVKPFDPAQIASECFGGEMTVTFLNWEIIIKTIKVSSYLHVYSKHWVQFKLEALWQCIPSPRHVLPVPPSGESVSAADLCPLTTSCISQ